MEAGRRETLQSRALSGMANPRYRGPDRNGRLRPFHVRIAVGFVRERNTVVPIQECGSLVPELNAFIPEANGCQYLSIGEQIAPYRPWRYSTGDHGNGNPRIRA